METTEVKYVILSPANSRQKSWIARPNGSDLMSNSIILPISLPRFRDPCFPSKGSKAKLPTMIVHKSEFTKVAKLKQHIY